MQIASFPLKHLLNAQPKINVVEANAGVVTPVGVVAHTVIVNHLEVIMVALSFYLLTLVWYVRFVTAKGTLPSPAFTASTRRILHHHQLLHIIPPTLLQIPAGILTRQQRIISQVTCLT